MRLVSQLKVNVKKSEALQTLHENMLNHKEIVDEARKGYVKKAKLALLKKLDKVEKGEIVQLHFSLDPPQDYTKVYKTAIKMLEMHTGDEVELNGEQVRHLIMDEWEWMNSFLNNAACYSETAVKYASVKGF